MRMPKILLTLLVTTLVTVVALAQVLPPVYDVENTGADCPQPPLPTRAELPTIEPLTDPFEWSDGSGRSTNFEDWECRRNEIKAEIEHYEIGEKPLRPDTITASYSGGTLTVNITVNGNTLTLTSAVVLPAGEGPFPAVIGMTGGTGSLPADIFTSRNIAQVPFNFGQVMAWQQVRGSEPINALYPDLIYMGAYSAWSWGVSRLIDGLELVQSELPIDLKHLAVTGCSFAGKMALFAGAFDERIALTIAQESGGGGAAAWRVSQTLGGVETLGATDHTWFIQDLFQFSNSVSKLPYDHHELMAMVAPRALFLLGNPDYVWLADESGYVSCKAAHEVWKTFGVPERFGFSIVGGHGHCALPDVEKPEVEAFVDAFLLGDTTVNTSIATHPYDYVDADCWMAWWGTGDPVFPNRDVAGTESVWLEPECGTVGENWDIVKYGGASNNYYVMVKDGLNSTSAAPADSASAIYFPFTVNTDTTFYVFARVNCATGNDDSYWVKMDDGLFEKSDGLITSGWKWVLLTAKDLSAGGHTLTISYSEDRARLDKICISSYSYLPILMGEDAINSCEPDINSIGGNLTNPVDYYELGQNYPNPFNPSTIISYNLPEKSLVTLKVYDVLGREIITLVNGEKPAGTYRINFDSVGLESGIYFYQLKAKNFIEKKKMLIIK
jgi:hypothetical protein